MSIIVMVNEKFREGVPPWEVAIIFLKYFLPLNLSVNFVFFLWSVIMWIQQLADCCRMWPLYPGCYSDWSWNLVHYYFLLCLDIQAKAATFPWFFSAHYGIKFVRWRGTWILWLMTVFIIITIILSTENTCRIIMSFFFRPSQSENSPSSWCF